MFQFIFLKPPIRCCVFDVGVVVMVGISVGEQHFVKGGIAQDLRTDGRKRLTYRPIYVETGVIPQVIKSPRAPLFLAWP